ncbi:aldo/keto reductase [Lysobacter silvisoli]|uniref:Aldo/keto reductase n=1 Tax=Lysobacter silvisoli TaxID=2293254 RepID=A0A371K1Q0_9GAMM|nr:aldo/keto reductase [Lysobacter silvisoli]RDZ27767.1 aldo/keto reductase [Lysobacter silvisoli]
MVSRRDFLATAGLAGTALALAPLSACSREAPPPQGAAGAVKPAGARVDEPPFRGTLLRRAIPSSGEQIPVIGMGTSGSFEVGDGAQARDPLREVLRRFVDAGATVIDTAPTYSSAEDVLGDLVAEAQLRPKLFLATKLSGVSGREEGLAQFAQSQQRLKSERIDLLQVHNLRDTQTQLALARELKQQGKVRYVGLTHYREDSQAQLAQDMRALKPDFVQINYSPVSRGAEREIFPLARELGIAVMINRAFEDGRLFAQVRDKPVPEWAAEVGADSWAQLFLKFVLSEPAVTVVIPATSKPKNQTDNLKAGVGALLDRRQRDALIAAVG